VAATDAVETMSTEDEEALCVVDFVKESQRDGGAKRVAELLQRLTNVVDVGGDVSVLEGTAWDRWDPDSDEDSDEEDSDEEDSDEEDSDEEVSDEEVSGSD